MSMTDPIADMLTRIRNACASKHRRVDIPVSRVKTEIARILKENNFIQDYQMIDTDDGKRLLRVRLKYAGTGQPVIRSLQRVSSPGLRRYVKAREIPRVKNGLGMAILSTPQGLMTDREARTARVGGEVLAVVW
jgi:small subunit ribosomal protein S8